MAMRLVRQYPDPALRVPATAIATVDDDIRGLVERMADIMRRSHGVGLAAPQIGVSQRIFLIDVSTAPDAPSDLRTFINPEITDQRGEVCTEEGCLSFPGIHEEVRRAERVTVRAQDAKGELFELSADGLLAIAIQHENDHLNGKLMVDHLSMLRKRLVHRSMVKRAAGEASAH
jgi:peptide deformylase